MPITFHPAIHKASRAEDDPNWNGWISGWLKCTFLGMCFANRQTGPNPFKLSNNLISRAESALSAKTPEDLLRGCSFTEHGKCEHIIQSSFSDPDLSHLPVEASNNGFVDAAIGAYNGHRNLIIRPDDVWLAILTQFNLYVNAHPEELRHHFVAHEGQKELEIGANFLWKSATLSTRTSSIQN